MSIAANNYKFYKEFSIVAERVISEMFKTERSTTMLEFIRRVLERTQVEEYIVLTSLVLLYRLKLRLVCLTQCACVADRAYSQTYKGAALVDCL